MPTEVYVDLYFLVNMSMDFLCLLITGRLLHRVCKSGRLLLASAIGGAYAVGSLLWLSGGARGVLFDLLCAVLLCFAAFWRRGEPNRRVLVSGAVFAAVSMALGGMMTALYTALNRLNLPLDALQGDTLSVWIFAILALVAGALTARGGRMMGLSQKSESVTVETTLFGKRVTLSALVDTGNLLTDPISGRGVILVEESSLVGVLPTPLARAIRQGGGALSHYLVDHPKEAARIRLIPTKTAMGEGMLAAILPDRLTIREGKATYPADYLLAPTTLGNADFDAVIPKG